MECIPTVDIMTQSEKEAREQKRLAALARTRMRRERLVFSGRELERVRLLAGVSVPQLAKALEVSRGLVYHWESGLKKPTVDRLADIARTLNVSIDTFYKEERHT